MTLLKGSVGFLGGHFFFYLKIQSKKALEFLSQPTQARLKLCIWKSSYDVISMYIGGLALLEKISKKKNAL